MKKLNIEKDNYFFSLGSRLAHKNAKWIISAAAQNPSEIFVISGSSFGQEDKEAKETSLKNVLFAGYLTDSEVKALMHNCKAFIQPSLCEGFGIPPMEAMSTGAQCIVAKAASLPEVYKNSVWYIDPLNYSDIDLYQIMQQSKENNSLILDEYSWHVSAEKFLNGLRSLL